MLERTTRSAAGALDAAALLISYTLDRRGALSKLWVKFVSDRHRAGVNVLDASFVLDVNAYLPEARPSNVLVAAGAARAAGFVVEWLRSDDGWAHKEADPMAYGTDPRCPGTRSWRWSAR